MIRFRNREENEATGWRLITRGTWYVLASVVAVVLVAQLRSVAVQAILAMIIAASVSPLADWVIGSTMVQSWRWKPGRVLIVLAVYVVLGVIGLILAILLVGTVAEQLTALVASLPQYAAQAEQWLGAVFPSTVDSAARGTLQAIGARVFQILGESLNELAGAFAGIVGATFGLIFTLILAVYFAADGERMQGYLIEFMPSSQQLRAARVMDVSGRRLGAWVRGQLAVSTMIGVIFGVGLGVIGVPYAALLGVVAFVGEFVPLVGPFISSVPAILVAFLTGGPTLGLITVVFCIVVEQLECDLIVPRIMGSATAIHPVAVLLAILAGAQLGGATGALLAVPVAGFVAVLVDELGRRRASTASVGTDELQSQPTKRPPEEAVTS
jgi:predicted PurR-regulated permease PerM